MAVSRDQINKHLDDFQENYKKVQTALAQNNAAIEQLKGAIWYIENVLLTQYDMDEHHKRKEASEAPPVSDSSESPPRIELVE